MTTNRWRGPGWRLLDAQPAQVRAARTWITGVFAHTALDDSGPDDPGLAALATSEMVTNAVVHGPAAGRVLVAYCLWPGGGRITVCDAGAGAVPCPRRTSATDEGGRGLAVLAAISSGWGTTRIAGARVVWCDLGQPAPYTAPADAWAWLHRLLATVSLTGPAHTGPREPASTLAACRHA